MKDRLYGYNDGTTAATTGTLTADNLSGLGMGGSLTVNEGTVADPIAKTHPGGVTYTNSEIVEILLGSGNDSFTTAGTAEGAITAIHGGGGADTLTITGNSGPLVIYGDTSQDGARYSGTLDDSQEDNANGFNNPGDDIIGASASNFGLTIYGGPGNDEIHGSQGRDNLAGGAGADKLYGEGGDDILFGDSGINANLEARTFQVVTTETAAADTLDGGEGNDILLGDHGWITYGGLAKGTHKVTQPGTMIRIESTSESNGANDTMDGGSGNDILMGGSGSDTMDGNSGNDLIAGDNAALDISVGNTAGIRYRTFAGPVYNPDGTINLGDASGRPGEAPFWYEFGITLNHLGITGDDILSGGDGEDMLFGQTGDDWMNGGDGDDYLEGGPGTDTIYGGIGEDDIIGGSSNLFGYSTAGKRPDAGDQIYGGDGRYRQKLRWGWKPCQ